MDMIRRPLDPQRLTLCENGRPGCGYGQFTCNNDKVMVDTLSGEIGHTSSPCLFIHFVPINIPRNLLGGCYNLNQRGVWFISHGRCLSQ